MKKFNTLIFHRIVEGRLQAWEDVSSEFFKELISKSLESGKIISSLKNTEAFNSDIVLTFDDGYRSDYEIVYPYLKERNLSATFFIVPEYVSQNGYMNWEQVQELNKSGMEIGSHSLSHSNLSELSFRSIYDDVVLSKKIIEDKIGSSVNSFSFPYGSYKRGMENLVFEAGYKYVCNSEPGINNKNFLIKRNAIHSASKNLRKILEPTFFEIKKASMYYHSRLLIKNLIGLEYYQKIKNLLLK